MFFGILRVFVHAYSGGSLEVGVHLFGDESWQCVLSQRGNGYCWQVDKQLRMHTHFIAVKLLVKMYLLLLPHKSLSPRGRGEDDSYLSQTDSVARSNPASIGCLNGSMHESELSLMTARDKGWIWIWCYLALVKCCLDQGWKLTCWYVHLWYEREHSLCVIFCDVLLTVREKMHAFNGNRA